LHVDLASNGFFGLLNKIFAIALHVRIDVQNGNDSGDDDYQQDAAKYEYPFRHNFHLLSQEDRYERRE
jgi:hypothetical protein